MLPARSRRRRSEEDSSSSSKVVKRVCPGAKGTFLMKSSLYEAGLGGQKSDLFETRQSILIKMSVGRLLLL